jgi:hypothetical protein
MGLLVLVLLGAGLGWAFRSRLEKWLSSKESILLGVTCGVFAGFVVDVAETGARLLNSASAGSMAMAAFGAILSVLLRRLFMESGS